MKQITPQLRSLAVPIDTLNLDPGNARVHDERGIEALKASLLKFGQTVPVVVQKKGMVVRAGNARVVAARELGWTEIAANVMRMGDTLAKAYAIADNRTAELAAWDDATLAGILEELKADEGLDLAVTGYTDDELEKLLAEVNPPEVVEDEVPEPEAKAVSKTGDLWLLGEHRVLCGDSTKAEDVGAVMGGDSAAIVATDPPYGVDFKGAKYNPRAKQWDGIAGDKRQGEELTAWLASVLGVCLDHATDDAVFYVWTAPMQEGAAAAAAMLSVGLHIQSQIVWVKNAFALGQADYHWRHEPCWYAYRKGHKHRWNGGRDKSTVWEVAKVANQSYEHPHQKPVELYARPLLHHTKEREVCLDPFLGSGTTLVAAEQLGRRCYGIEIEPRYVDVTVRRWQKLTGKRATLDGTKRTFDAVAKARVGAGV